MYKQSIYIICLLCLLSFVGCKRMSSHEKRVTDLERRALNHSADRLLNKADSLCHDSTIPAIRDAFKARDFGAKGDMDSSAYYIRKVEDYCYAQEPSERISNILAYIENVKAVNWIYASSKSSPLQDSAVAALEKSIHYSILGKNYERIFLTYYNISSIYSNRDEYAKSVYYTRKAMFLADSLKVGKENTYFLYTSSGLDNVAMGDYKNAQRDFDKASKSLRYMTAEDLIALYSGYCDLYRREKKYGKAVSYMKKALDEVRGCEVAERWMYYSILSSYASVLVEANINLPEARTLLEQSLDYYRQEKDRDQALSMMVMLIKLAILQNDRALTRQHISEALREGIETSAVATSTRLSWLETMDDYYRRTGNFKRAYDYNKQAVAMKDSISGYAKQQYIANLNMQYRQDTTLLSHRVLIRQQEAEISSLYWRYVVMALVVVIVLLLFGGYYIYTRRRRASLYNRYISNINRLKMQNIRNCISPHFTFNVLNHEIELNSESKEKHDRLVDLTYLLRKSLDSTGSITVSLASELDFINSYVHLLNECGKRFTYRLHLEDGIDTTTVLIPSMIVQIPVENAVKHGFLTENPAYYVHIDVKSGSAGIEIEIRNNGASYSPFARVDKTKSTGIGMQVIFQSLLILNMKNKNKITFAISDRKDEGESGTKVVIHIPYKFDYSVLS